MPKEKSEDDDAVGKAINAISPEHSERKFIFRALVTIALILVLQTLLRPFMGIILLFSPLIFLLGIRLHAMANNQDPNQLLHQYLTVTPFIRPESDSRFKGVAWVTYGLIGINILVYYIAQPLIGDDFIRDNLVFYPYAPTPINVPTSAVASIFLHGSGAHLWGNMTFLWAIGTVIELRMNRSVFLMAYLATGIAAGLLAALMGLIATGSLASGLGASGAISGLMGIFVVRCYFKRMDFPLPLLGIFSLIIPLAIKVRMNAMVVIGLFFFADLSGGISQITGTNNSNIGHWAHIGGMLSGLAVARRLKLEREAIEERHLDIGERALTESLGIGTGEKALRRVLEENPDNQKAALLLARTLSQAHATNEGGVVYRQAIRLLITKAPNEAADVFREYFEKYQKGVDASVDLRIARILWGRGEGELSTRCLEMIVRDADSISDLREKAMYQLTVSLKQLGYEDAARNYREEFLHLFPQSSFVSKIGNV